MAGRNKNRIRWMTAALVLLVFFHLGFLPVRADSCRTKKLNNAKDAVSMLKKNWESSYFQEIRIRENSDKIEVDGKKGTFTGTFSVNRAVMKKAVSSGKNLSLFLEQQKNTDGAIYSLKKTGRGAYAVTAPYQSRRIVVNTTSMSASYGASEKYIYKEGKETILCFDTEEKTRKAFEKIRKVYGRKNCYVDEIFSVENMSMSAGWGAVATEMADLKSSVPASGLTSQVTVAVIDTGINRSHSIFSGRTILPDSYNMASGNGNITDTNGHGTHVAGIIADTTPANVRFLIIKIADAGGSSSSLIVNLAMNYAISHNADVMNVSYGFLSPYAFRYTFLDKVIDKAYTKGIPIVTAAGNITEGIPGRDVNNCYPACNEQTVAVSALNRNLSLAEYSYYGSAIDFCAPGSRITSAWVGSVNGYREESGTSMAAPHITSALAYIKLRNRNLSVQGSCLELRRYCVDLGSPGKDALYGSGCPRMKNLFGTAGAYDSWTVSSMPGSPVISLCRNDQKGTMIQWGPVSGAKGYYVYRRLNGGANKKVATVTGNYYLDRQTEEGDYCVYQVVAFAESQGAVKKSGYSNTATNITLKPLRITKLKAAGKKKVVLKQKRRLVWANKRIQIQYSKSKTFKKAGSKSFPAEQTSCRFGAGKKGKVYIRARSRFRWQGVTYYSAWSKAKKVKVK